MYVSTQLIQIASTHLLHVALSEYCHKCTMFLCLDFRVYTHYGYARAIPTIESAHTLPFDVRALIGGVVLMSALSCAQSYAT